MCSLSETFPQDKIREKMRVIDLNKVVEMLKKETLDIRASLHARDRKIRSLIVLHEHTEFLHSEELESLKGKWQKERSALLASANDIASIGEARRRQLLRKINAKRFGDRRRFAAVNRTTSSSSGRESDSSRTKSRRQQDELSSQLDNEIVALSERFKKYSTSALDD